jgi:hypothetical protein
MNIFLTSFNPKEAASHLDDLRLNKMILETAQLLSSSYRHFFGENEALYKDTHLNHPCAIWARKNTTNYSWLVDYFNELAQEKIRRDLTVKKQEKVKAHKSWQVLFAILNSKKDQNYTKNISKKSFDFNCTDFKEEKDVRIAYQKQLAKKWNKDFRSRLWTGSQVPEFFNY